MISITIQYDSQLKLFSGCAQHQIEVPTDSSLQAVLQQLTTDVKPELENRILTENGQVQPTLLLFVNDQAMSSEQVANETLKNGDIVSLYTPIAGG